jgi:hypothetical protein
MRSIIYILFGVVSVSTAQVTSFPYTENFDGVTSPSLPAGWTTSKNKAAAGDFWTIASVPRSTPNALIDSNATKEQWAATPQLNFTGKFVDSILFYERRVASHNSDVLLEAIINDDTTAILRISDTLRNPGNTNYTLRRFALPETLNNQSNIKFRWRVLGNGTGTGAATIRFDDIRITVKKAVDLAVTSLLVSPAVPKKGETVTATAWIKNRALSGNFSGMMQLFDSLTFVTSQNFSQSLIANESLTVVLNYPNITAGRHPLTVRLILSGDEDTTNNSLSLVVNAGYQPRTVLINEFKHTGSPEWVEFVNNSNDTINIAQWKIADNTATLRTITSQQTLIPPHRFFIASAGSLSEIYPSIPAPVIIVSSFPALNDGGDAIRIIDPTNFTIDSLTYDSSWPTVSGKSFERVDTALASTLQSNWKISVHPLGATPGMINSVTQKAYDAAVKSISVSPQFPVTGDVVTVSSIVKNIGKQNLTSLTFQLYVDVNKDSVLVGSEVQFQQNVSSLNAGDSIALPVSLPSLAQGTYWLFAKIVSAQDDDTTNNIMFFALSVGIPKQSVVVNEIMYAPTGDMPEWIECFNRSTSPITVAGWKISDNGTTKTTITNSAAAVIQPQSYFIVAHDTLFNNSYTVSVPVFFAPFSALNNTTPDAVVLFDERGAVMDSVYYKPNWGGTNGLSLQRFDVEGNSTDSANWKSAVPTPGAINTSVRKESDVLVRRISIAPSFPIVNQSITVNAVVANIGRQAAANLSVEFYLDANNDSIAAANELKAQYSVASLAVLDSAAIIAQFAAEQSGAQRIVVKIIFSDDEELSNNTGMLSINVGAQTQSVIVTEIMYNPQNDMPEWIEFYNRSTSPVSIVGWKISDNGTTKTTITNSAVVIQPQSYFVVAADSVFMTYYSISVPLFIARFSTLNNTTPDAVVLFDNQNRLMDSVYYKQSWGGSNGQSLQRFDIFGSSTDSANWRTALPSPGGENIVARKDFDVAVKSISSVKNANGTRLQATIINTGRQTANSVIVKMYYDANNDSVAQQHELIYSTNASSIVPLDSSTVQYDWIHSLQGRHIVIISIDYPLDERLSNNTALHTVVNGFVPQSLVINEIMYEPLSGNTEFVELLNRSSDTIDVADWKLMDQPASSGNRTIVTLSKQKKNVPPNSYLIVAGDSSVFTQFPLLAEKFVVINNSLSLNNSGEDLVLIDLTGAQIDSVRYSPSWHLKNVTTAGRSLERINPNTPSNDQRNWSSSVAKSGASPAQTNSIYIASVAPGSGMILTPNPFSPDNDGFEDFLSINYSLPTNSATIRIRIYDVTGRLVRRLAQNEPSPSNGSIVWNGLDDDGRRVRIGMYIILFEAFDNFGGTVKTMKDVAVVARKL